jgi:hypothetical protein
MNGTSFRFTGLAEGRYVVTARSATGGDSETIEVAAGETKRVTLSSDGEASVDGTVLDHATREPIADVACFWQVKPADGGQSYGGLSRVRSDEKGRFSLTVPARRPLTIRCYPKHWDTQHALDSKVTLEAGGHADVEILLMTGRTAWPERGYLGVRHLSDTGETIVSAVIPDSPADHAGLLKGDGIVKVDGTPVAGWDDGTVRFVLSDHAPGETVKLEVRRGTDVLTYEVKLGKVPEE